MVIYLTTNIITNKKYIGKDSKNNPKYIGSGTLLKEDIVKYGKENFKKEILEHCSSIEELAERESFWIQLYNAIYSNEFYNLIDFNTGWNLDKIGKEKHKLLLKKISQNSKGKKRPPRDPELKSKRISEKTKGKPKPPGFGDMISKMKIGNKFSKETCEKISQGKTGKKHPPSFAEKKYKPIIQLDINNKIIKEYKSIESATQSNPKFKRSNISCCLIGYTKTAYGFIWKYKN